MTTIITRTHDEVEGRLSMTDDVLSALSAFPTPPNHIPESPASATTASSSFSLPRKEERDAAPPSSFNRGVTRTVPPRRDSAASGTSVGSAQSSKSGKLSVLVNGRDVEYGRGREEKRDSGSGSSTSSGNLGAPASMLPSPLSGRSYFTAPNSPLPPGTPGAGPSSDAGRESSSSSLNTPASLYPLSTSPSSAYPPSSASTSPYPHSSAYSYSGANRFAFANQYTPTSSSSPSPASMLPSAHPMSSARLALSMLSTPASASGSSSPSSAHVPISAVMSPIQERDERPRRRSSVAPTSEIGGPPSVPLPPLPSSAKSNSSIGESTPKPTQTVMPVMSTVGVGPRAPSSVKSLPSLRSSRSGKSSSSHGHGHGRKESGVSVVSVVSTVSGTSAFSAVAPSLAEFGVATRRRVEEEVELGEEVLARAGQDRESIGERPRSRARTPRTGAVPLRIDIPLSYTQEKQRSLGSATSASSPFPRELGERVVRERANRESVVHSPTASLFSVASGVTQRSGGGMMSSAQSLRTRVSGLLDGLGAGTGYVSPPVLGSARTSPGVGPGEGGGGGEAFQKRVLNSSLHPTTTSTSTSTMGYVNGSSSRSSGASSINRNGDGLLTTEDLHSDPILARAVTPLEDGNERAVSAPSPSPLEQPSMGRMLRAMMQEEAVPLVAQVAPLSGADTEGSGCESEKQEGVDLLIGRFPSTPTMSRFAAQFPPSSFPFPASGSGPGSTHTQTRTPKSAPLLGVSTSGMVSRTLSQSRRKPLPPAPNGLRASVSSVSSLGSFVSARSRVSSSSYIGDDANSSFRGRKMRARGAEGNRAASPDIAQMMCATPRPVLRSKSASARTSRSSRSLSMRSNSVRDRARPSLPDDKERQLALARFSAASSSSSGALSRTSGGPRRSLGSDIADAYGGIDEPVDVDGDASVDYGVAIARHRGAYDLSPSLLHVDERLETENENENEVDEFGAIRSKGADLYAEMNGSPEGEEEESDSDIDLHTPLPHIFLREGVLSPQSKVLASASSMGSISARSSFVASGRDSVVSNVTNASFGSVMTKSGLYKDERNTEGRRRRHRDGKNLREGLGLTTGLGWSDSEDEDAPSPFTHRPSNVVLSLNATMASVRSKQSQFMSRSTPASALASRTTSTRSTDLPRFAPSRSSRSPGRQSSELRALTKSYSTLNLPRRGDNLSHVPQMPMKMATAGDENRSRSPTAMSSCTGGLPCPPTPRDDVCDEAGSGSVSVGRSRSGSTASRVRAKTPTGNSVRSSRSSSQLRPRATSSVKSAPASRLPPAAPTTPRPLRLPALQLQGTQGSFQLEEGGCTKLQPGQPEPHSGSILGYNRNLHDRQRAQLTTATAVPDAESPPAVAHSFSSGSLPAASPALSAQSAPSSSAGFGSRKMYGSMPATASSSLRPPASTGALRAREPSPTPSRLSAPSSGIGRPRTGTGMVYLQSSLPPPQAVARATAI